MKYETQYARSGDYSLAYQVIGNGPRDLVFVPGVISHVEFFHELPGYTEFMEALASFARVIVFDKLGNGMSDRVPGAPSLEQRIDDVPAIMEAVGSKRATLFGVSEGGPISLLFAATHPERVESMVLYETFVCYGGIPGDVVGPTDLHKQFSEYMFANYGKGLSLLGFGGSYYRGPPPSELVRLRKRVPKEELDSIRLDPQVQELWGRAERLSNSPGGFRAIYEMLHKIDARAALPAVKCPVLIMHAANGSMFEEQSKYLEEHLPNARRVALEGVDHFPWFAGAEKVIAETEEFVTGERSHASGDRALATLMFIDITDSTKLAAELGDRRWREITQSYYSIVRRELARFRGIEFGTEGDGFFARFDGPARAVSCAYAIRDGVHALGLKIHAGLHTGEIEIKGEEVSGIAANIAARVVSIATADQVLVTRTVKDLVIGSGLQFKDSGSHELKGVPDSWQLYAVS